MAANDTSQMSTNVFATLHRNTEPRGFRTIVKYLQDNNRNVKQIYSHTLLLPYSALQR